MGFVFKLLLVIVFVAGIQDIHANDDIIATLVKRMDALEARNDALETRNDGLEAIIDALEVKNKVLFDGNKDLNARIKALEVKSTNQEEEIKRLAVISEKQSASDKDEAGRLEEPAEQIRPGDTARHIKEIYQDKAQAMSRMRKASNEVSVAFFALLNHHIDNPGVHQAVAFDNVVTNVGNAYNPHAGDFRAPVSGVYVFSATLMSGDGSVPFHFTIMRNGSGVSNIYIPNGGTATQEVVLQLSQGDDVVIHNLDAGHRVYGYGYSSFSGFLLQQDYSDAGLVVGK